VTAQSIFRRAAQGPGRKHSASLYMQKRLSQAGGIQLKRRGLMNASTGVLSHFCQAPPAAAAAAPPGKARQKMGSEHQAGGVSTQDTRVSKCG